MKRLFNKYADLNNVYRNIPYKNSLYEDALYVYNNLSDSDKQLVSPNGKFVDSPYLVSRRIKYINSQPVGFCEAYRLNGTSTTSAFIIIAVLNEYRGYNIASELIRQVCSDCAKQRFINIIWKCDKDNIASKNVALKNHFTLENTTKNQLTFKLDLSHLIDNNTIPYISRLKRRYYPIYTNIPYSTYINGYGPRFFGPTYYNSYIPNPPINNPIDHNSINNVNDANNTNIDTNIDTDINADINTDVYNNFSDSFDDSFGGDFSSDFGGDSGGE